MKGFPEIPDEGLFGPGSPMWKINRERIVLLGGGAASVLQVAHPAVALGVAEHSDFVYDTLGRLTRTINAVYAIAFGRRDTVARTASRVREAHRPVRGGAEQLAPAHERKRYNAFDPDLQLWVLATLVMTSISQYETYVGTLEEGEKQGFLEDMRVWGAFFGLPPDHGPREWPAFHAYYQEMLHGDLLGSHPVCGEMARAVVYPRYPLWLKGVALPLQFLVTEALPPPLRGRLGLDSRPWKAFAWKTSRRVIPPIYRHLPDALRFPREYRDRVA